MVEALRSLVGENGWEYCILWKLSQDQRFLEWTGCCCFGSEASIANGGALFPGSASGQRSPCRDMVVQHPRTRSCDALSEFPSSIPLDSSLGIYEHVLISNQPTWLTKPPECTSPVVDQYAVGAKTRVLVPVQSGLVELFVSKHIAEDQHIIDFVTSQCNSTQGMDGYDYTWIPGMTSEQGNFSWENSMADQSQLYNSPLNLLDGVKNGTGDQVFFDGSAVQAIQQTGNLEMDSCDMAGVAYHRSGNCVGGETAGGQDISKESVKQEAALRADSGSDGTDDDEDPRPTVGRNGKRHHSKNLVAERKRRKKLNDRLYALRALVPKITKMDRASILGDAIEYVMELQKQVKDLQDELEEDTNPEDDETKEIGSNCKLDPPNPNGVVIMSNGMELDESPNSSRLPPANNARASDAMKLQAGHEQSNEDNKGNQMEPQVEVRQVEGNEFFLKVFCEHKAGGFARLMEAMSSLGLEVTNANVTTFRTLVLNVFRVEKREDDLLQVDQVRNSLLEITRGQSGGWPEPAQFVMNGGDYLGTQNQLHYLNHQL